MAVKRYPSRYLDASRFRLYPSRGPFVVLLLIILAGFALRLYRLGAQSLWYDETVSAFLAGQPVPALIAHTGRDIHPPGYYLLLHFWKSLAGDSEFALAFFSLIFGVLLIPLVYRLARYLAGHSVATWSVLLVASSPFNIWYSQEVRMYTLSAVLGVAVTYCIYRALNGGRATPFFWLGYGISAAAGLYTLYYFAWLLLLINLFFLISLLVGHRRQLIALLVANALVLVLYLPWLPIAWRQATEPPVPPWRSPASLPPWPVLLESWTALSLGQSVETAAVWPVLLLTLALFGTGWYHLRRMADRRFDVPLFLFLYTFGPLFFIHLVSLLVPLYHVRYIYIYSPAFYIVLGAGLAWLATRGYRWPVWTAAGLLLAASLFSLYRFHVNPRYQADDYRSAVRFIQSHWQPGDVMMVNAGYVYTAFLYYSDFPDLERRRLVPYSPQAGAGPPLLLQTGTVDGSPLLGWGEPQADFYAMSAAETVSALENLSEGFYRLWLLRAYDTVTDPTGLIRTWLDENAIPIENELFAGPSNIRVQGYLFPQPPPIEAEPIRFEDGMALVGWQFPAQTWQPGQTVPVQLWWAALASPQVDYKMSLKLWHPSGELAAKGHDAWPVGPLFQATDWPLNQPVYQAASLPLPADLSPGQYWLNVELYHPDTVQPLPLLKGGGAVTLGPVNVESQ